MNKKTGTILAILLLLASCGWKNDTLIISKKGSSGNGKSIYDFTLKSIEGVATPLSKFKGKVVLIVNVASKCGLVSQYKDLQELYKRYQPKGLEILGFPANNFLSQEPGKNKDIQQFCQSNYGVSFSMFGKISVKGESQHPLYSYLTSKKENGLFDAPVKWNFQKYLISKNGRLVASIGPANKVLDKKIIAMIEKLLGE